MDARQDFVPLQEAQGGHSAVAAHQLEALAVDPDVHRKQLSQASNVLGQPANVPLLPQPKGVVVVKLLQGEEGLFDVNRAAEDSLREEDARWQRGPRGIEDFRRRLLHLNFRQQLSPWRLGTLRSRRLARLLEAFRCRPLLLGRLHRFVPYHTGVVTPGWASEGFTASS